jgi:hypothetical protein
MSLSGDIMVKVGIIRQIFGYIHFVLRFRGMTPETTPAAMALKLDS